jgi:TldD protein
VQIANSLGVNVTDTRTNYRLYLDVFVEGAGKSESFSRNLYSTTDALFYESVDTDQFTTDTVNSALTMLKADFAPAGEMPVILENGFGGVIFHEACGHGLETTSVAQNASVFCDKLNQKVAENVVTAIDDGTIHGEWGSLKFDDEGSLTKKTTLIDKGILNSYMADLLGAKKTGYEKTGSSRRESYKFAPTSRMRNTFIAAGTTPLEEMIKDIDYGLYAKDMGGGSVSPGTGDFNFSVREAYIIRNGRLEEPVKGASLIGRGIETLGRITKVGTDLKHAAGMCGSVSGSIPAAVGQPALLVSKIIVGGRAK